MSKKNGRPESWNADYFPHHTEVSMELKYLEHTYGAEGYRAYWRIQEQLAKADYHYLNLEKEYDIQTFRLNCNVPSEILDEIITYLLDRGVLDKDMYDENKLWMPKLIELLKPLYSNRRKSPPQKVGTDIVTTCKNPQYSKQSKDKAENTKDITTTDDFDVYKSDDMVSKVIDSYKQDNPELDTDKTFYELKKRNPNPTPDDVIRFFENALDNNMDIKRPDDDAIEIQCSECDNLDYCYSLEDMKETLSWCCKAKWIYPNGLESHKSLEG